MANFTKYGVHIFKTIQIILGSLFVVSGFVKGVDPVGSYKVSEYLELFGLDFLVGFTIVTLYLVIDPLVAIQGCGCFGDAFKLTNTETFIKNVLFTFLAIIYFRRQWITHNVLSSSGKRVICIGLTIWMAIISLFIPFYSITYLPPFDFSPFNRGVNILENINKNNTTSNGEIFLIYRNKQSG